MTACSLGIGVAVLKTATAWTASAALTVVTRVHAYALGAGEPLGLLAGYRAHLECIDVRAKPRQPDRVGAFPSSQVERAARSALGRCREPGGVEGRVICWVSAVSVGSAPPVPVVCRVLAVEEIPDGRQVTGCRSEARVSHLPRPMSVRR
jgi:hypothetical protein